MAERVPKNWNTPHPYNSDKEVRSTKPLTYQDQSPDALALSLVVGEIDRGQLNILATSRFSHEAISVEASIIGGSHAIRFQAGDVVVWEVFACHGITESRQPYQLGRLLGQRLPLWVSPYWHTFECHETSLEAATDQLARLALRPRHSRYAFPTNSAADQVPLTLVSGHVDPNGAVVMETAHSYPTHDRVIFTRSQFSQE